MQTEYGRDTRLPRHSHAAAYLCVVVRGGFIETMSGRAHPCGPGALILNLTGEPHQDRFTADRTSVLNVELPDSWIGAATGLGEGPRYCGGSRCAAAARRVERALGEAGALADVVVEGLVAELFLRCGQSASRRGCGAAPSWLETVSERLAECCADPPSLTEMSRELGVHPSHLCRVFRRRHGVSIGEFIRRERAFRAREAVERGGSPLAEIAAAFGFADQSHMTRCFRARFGVTPGELRSVGRSAECGSARGAPEDPADQMRSRAGASKTRVSRNVMLGR